MAERAAEATNFVPKDKIQNFAKEIAGELDELASLKGGYMSACKVHREQIKSVYDAAKDAGVPKASLKAALKAIDLEKKAVAARQDLEDIDLRAKYDMIRDALDELPLFNTAAAPEVTKTTKNGQHATA